jgi:hypothetical protein
MFSGSRNLQHTAKLFMCTDVRSDFSFQSMFCNPVPTKTKAASSPGPPSPCSPHDESMTSDRNKKVPNESQPFYANEFPIFTLLAIPTSLKHKFKVICLDNKGNPTGPRGRAFESPRGWSSAQPAYYNTSVFMTVSNAYSDYQSGVRASIPEYTS